MAIWGNLSLQDLGGSDLDVVRGGRTPNKGILADYLADFADSVAKNLAVYSISSGQGFVWIANYGSNGSGSLRFFAIDADALGRARVQITTATTQSPQPASSAESDRRKARGQQELVDLKSLLDSCGASCSANPQADLARREVIDLIDYDKLIASEATDFVAALRDATALNRYLANC